MYVSECVLAFIGLVHAASLGVIILLCFFSLETSTYIWWPLSPFIYNCVCRFELKWFWFIFYFHWHRDTIPFSFDFGFHQLVDIDCLYRWWFSVLIVHRQCNTKKKKRKKTHIDGRCCLQIPIACITCNWIAKIRCAWPKLFIPLAWHTYTHTQTLMHIG